MKKRSASSAKSRPSILSPRPNPPAAAAAGPSKLPKTYGFDDLELELSSSMKKPPAPTPSPLAFGSPAANSSKAPSTVADLRDLASSRMNELKKYADHSHCEVLKETEASKTRISKRLKVQTQACMQLTEEVDKDFKKISDRITENAEVMKDSYAKIISEVQASASRAMKVTIPELAQSLEKRIEGLRNRHKVTGTPISLSTR